MGKAKLYSVRELASITGMPINTLHTYLGRYCFADFREKQLIGNSLKEVYKFNKSFAYRLCDFLKIMRRYDAVERLIEFCEKKEDL